MAKQLTNVDVERLIAEALQKQLEKLTPHKCQTCKHFIYRKMKPRNWVCRYPGKLEWDWKAKVCLKWTFDPSKHYSGH